MRWSTLRTCTKITLTICLTFGMLHLPTTAAQSVEGFAEPVELVDVASPESGTIHEVLVRQGQTVRKGDPLIQMDQETLLPALELAKAKAEARRLEAAKIEVQVKQRRLENLQRLGREHSSSEEVVRATADVELARTQVMAAEEEIRQSVLEARRIEVQLARRTIRSPINGVVTRIHRRAGEFVTTTEPLVVTVADLSRLRIILHPASPDAESLAAATRAVVRLERGSESVETSIDFVSPVTSADSGTVRVELLLDNPGGKYRSGIRCWLIGALPDGSQATLQSASVPEPRPEPAAQRQ